jgi:hypothetical protein
MKAGGSTSIRKIFSHGHSQQSGPSSHAEDACQLHAPVPLQVNSIRLRLFILSSFHRHFSGCHMQGIVSRVTMCLCERRHGSNLICTVHRNPRHGHASTTNDIATPSSLTQQTSLSEGIVLVSCGCSKVWMPHAWSGTRLKPFTLSGKHGSHFRSIVSTVLIPYSRILTFLTSKDAAFRTYR